MSSKQIRHYYLKCLDGDTPKGVMSFTVSQLAVEMGHTEEEIEEFLAEAVESGVLERCYRVGGDE